MPVTPAPPASSPPSRPSGRRPSHPSGHRASSPGSGARAIAPGTRIDVYIVEMVLGAGGMGSVLRVRHDETGVLYALKLIHADLVELDTEFALGRFRREVEVLARVDDHRNIVRVHGCGLFGRVPYCVMEYVDGVPLSDLLAAGEPLPPKRAAALVARLGRALQHVHRHGVVHRDLKPENVLIEPGGEPRLTDFGLAYDATGGRLTRTGELLGTPAFMAPEQVTPERYGGTAGGIGARTDVYGLGTVLYGALTARAPYEGESAQAVLLDVVAGPPRPVGQLVKGLPRDLERICARAMERDPGRRYETAAAFAEDLERWLRGDPISISQTNAFGEAWERVSPRRSVKSLLAWVVGLAAIATIVAATYVTVVDLGVVDPVVQIAEIEERLERRGRLAEADQAILTAVVADPDTPEAGPIARRLDLLVRLDALTRPEAAADPRADVAALTELVRPFGGIDGELLARTSTVLERAGQLGALSHVLWGARPRPGPVASPIARAIARAVAVGERAGALEPIVPADDVAFDELTESLGDDADDRRLLGHLHRRRGEVSLARGERGWATAVRSFTRADRLGIAVASEDWPEAFAEHGRKLLDELVKTDRDVHVGWPLARLLERRAGKVGGPDALAELSDELLAILSAGLMAGAEEVAGEDFRNALVTAAFLDGLGRNPIQPEAFGHLAAVIGGPALEELARVELQRSPGERNPALLMIAGRCYQKLDSTLFDRRLPLQWADEAWEAGLETRSLRVYHALLALELRTGPENALAIEQASLAHALENGLPDEERYPAVAETLARALLTSPDPDDRRRAIGIAIEALQVQAATLSRVDEVSGAWVYSRQDEVLEVARTAAQQLAFADDLGLADVERDRLAERIVTLGAGVGKPEHEQMGNLLFTGARCSARAGRREEALARFAQAFELKDHVARHARNGGDVGWYGRLYRDLAGWHVIVARLHERWGDPEAAAAELDAGLAILEDLARWHREGGHDAGESALTDQLTTRLLRLRAGLPKQPR